MRAISVGDTTGIGTATTVGTRDKVITSADSNFKKRVDIFVRVGGGGGITVRWCWWSWFERIANIVYQPRRSSHAGWRSRARRNAAGILPFVAVPKFYVQLLWYAHTATRTSKLSPVKCWYQENIPRTDQGIMIR